MTTLGVAFILSLIIISGRFLGYMAEAAEGFIEGQAIFLVLFYRLPEFLGLILPLSLFLGVLLTYGRMYVEYEMIVLKACGVGQWRLVVLTLFPAVCMAALVAYLSLALTHEGYQKSNALLVQQYTRSALELLTPGNFLVTKKGDVVYAQSLNTDKTELKGFFTSAKNKGEFVTIVAESGKRFVDQQSGGQYMELFNGYRYEVAAGESEINEIAFGKYLYKLESPDTNRIRNRIQSMNSQELRVSKNSDEQAELQWRLALGPLAFIIVLLAVPLSKANPRQGRFLKLIPAVLIYLAYVSLILIVKGAIADGTIGLYPGVWVVHGIFLLLAVVLIEWERISLLFFHWKARP